MTTFSYAPVTRPELPSRMLQKAYNENLSLVGPEGRECALIRVICLNFYAGDPDGWHSVPPLTIQGKFFGSHTAEVTLSVSHHHFRRIKKVNITFTACPRETCKNTTISPMSELTALQADLWSRDSHTALADPHRRRRTSPRPTLDPQGNQTSPRSFLGHRVGCHHRH